MRKFFPISEAHDFSHVFLVEIFGEHIFRLEKIHVVFGVLQIRKRVEGSNQLEA